MGLTLDLIFMKDKTQLYVRITYFFIEVAIYRWFN